MAPKGFALVCDGLTVHDRHGAVRLDNFTLEIRPGEIVGLAGVEGNGQSELGMVLAGLLRPTEGHFYIGGSDLTHAGAAAVTAAGGGIVPEDRHAVACVTAMSVAENMFLNKLDRFTRFGLLQRGALNAAAQKQMREFDVRAAGPEVAFSGLSGGNQQKAVLARELTLDPLVALVAAQPTRGLDVSAVEAVYRQIRAAARRGVGVLLISSELDELLAVADRVAVLYRGRLVGERPAEMTERGAIGALMSGQDRMTALALSLPDRRRLLGMAVPFVAVVGSMIVGLLLIAASGKDVPDAIEAFMDGAFGNAFAIGASINRAVALSLVGLGFILAFRANLTNVGGEGQIAVGGIAATALGLWPPIANLPLGLAVIVPLLGGTLAGAFWGGIAGVMKVRFGTNEVISTLLLGFVALLLVYWCVQSTALLRQPQTSSATLPESLSIADSVKLPSLTGNSESPLHIGLVICLLLAVVTAIVLQRSTFGLRLRAIGLNELAARRAGMPGGILLVVALAMAGAFGGLAGAIMLQGEQYYLKTGFSSGYGFDGLVVGLLSRGSTVGVLAGALFFGFLRSGGISMEIMAGVPAALTLVIQGLIVIAVAGSVILVEKLQGGR